MHRINEAHAGQQKTVSTRRSTAQRIRTLRNFLRRSGKRDVREKEKADETAGSRRNGGILVGSERVAAPSTMPAVFGAFPRIFPATEARAKKHLPVRPFTLPLICRKERSLLAETRSCSGPEFVRFFVSLRDVDGAWRTCRIVYEFKKILSVSQRIYFRLHRPLPWEHYVRENVGFIAIPSLFSRSRIAFN